MFVNVEFDELLSNEGIVFGLFSEIEFFGEDNDWTVSNCSLFILLVSDDVVVEVKTLFPGVVLVVDTLVDISVATGKLDLSIDALDTFLDPNANKEGDFESKFAWKS